VVALMPIMLQEAPEDLLDILMLLAEEPLVLVLQQAEMALMVEHIPLVPEAVVAVEEQLMEQPAGMAVSQVEVAAEEEEEIIIRTVVQVVVAK